MPVLENIVCNYALSKGNEVSVGRVGELKCDFVMRSSHLENSYVQVALTIMARKEIEERKLLPFADNELQNLLIGQFRAEDDAGDAVSTALDASLCILPSQFRNFKIIRVSKLGRSE